jgi:hypothetical protein
VASIARNGCGGTPSRLQLSVAHDMSA